MVVCDGLAQKRKLHTYWPYSISVEKLHFHYMSQNPMPKFEQQLTFISVNPHIRQQVHGLVLQSHRTGNHEGNHNFRTFTLQYANVVFIHFFLFFFDQSST